MTILPGIVVGCAADFAINFGTGHGYGRRLGRCRRRRCFIGRSGSGGRGRWFIVTFVCRLCTIGGCQLKRRRSQNQFGWWAFCAAVAVPIDAATITVVLKCRRTQHSWISNFLKNCPGQRAFVNVISVFACFVRIRGNDCEGDARKMRKLNFICFVCDIARMWG